MNAIIPEHLLAKKYQRLMRHLNEKTLRLCAAADAICLGRGGISAIAQASGLARNTIYAGIKEMEADTADDGAAHHPHERKRRLVSKIGFVFSFLMFCKFSSHCKEDHKNVLRGPKPRASDGIASYRRPFSQMPA